MKLNIKTASDPVHIGGLVTLIYGQPGIGKTSLGFSSDAPLLLDFENGAYRSAYRKNYVQISNWTDISGITDTDLEGYKTIVVDTLGACLDSVTRHLINSNPKMLNRTTGGLSLPGFGSLKMSFTNWIHRIHNMGLDVVLLAHAKEKNNNDSTTIRPDITGSSYDEMMKVSTLVGYYSVINENGKNIRCLNFNPTEQWVGKNSAGFEALSVPNLSANPNYLSEILSEARSNMGEESDQMAKENEIVDTWRAKVESSKTPNDLNSFIKEINETVKNTGTARLIKGIIVKRAKDQKLEWDGVSGQYKEGS